ncbi:DNA-processing protein DprA [Hydrogenovibrio sp. 3SP14C1]|uniref:DNA-processing protein DprA n=1 Tax=Hydrogenovibrio sp. 3SP14C1 TaxID=3038774 RepID=UPI00241783C7|nr:DNA-processing protein DprA [Hydrogenovibrio sp. 3SP14C1]MDG4813233.1 DNA-processing protein DprA [Hydrogenovibrio sp. 3SP14C1]
MSDLDNMHDWLLLHFARINAKQLPQITSYFGSISQAMAASQASWQSSQLLKPKQLERLFDSENNVLVAEAVAWSQQPEQTILTLKDAAYPELLKRISDPPILLYVRGDVSLLSEPQLAIVGSRNASKQGRLTAMDFAQYLASVGLTITSGLASGIDKAAHEGALQAGASSSQALQGTTVAVVATGLDRVYPAANRELARQIANQGVLVSEYPLGSKPMAHFFPQRNRIISGLSVGTLVVEAALKSGSLITARTALEQDREVFAVPGSINSPQAKGCHQLIRQGAKLVESGQDILEELSAILQLSLNDTSAEQDGSNEKDVVAESSSLLQYIEFEPIGLDELVVLSKLPVSDIQSQLLMLELEGSVEALSAGRWRRLN